MGGEVLFKEHIMPRVGTQRRPVTRENVVFTKQR